MQYNRITKSEAPRVALSTLPAGKAADAVYAAAREAFICDGEDGLIEWPVGSGQIIWSRYDDKSARAAGFNNYGEDGALDAHFHCGIAIPV